jgi:hypothetical protein
MYDDFNRISAYFFPFQFARILKYALQSHSNSSGCACAAFLVLWPSSAVTPFVVCLNMHIYDIVTVPLHGLRMHAV